MSIKVELLEKFALLSSEEEIKSFLEDIILVLYEINNSSHELLVKNNVMSEENSDVKQEKTNLLLRQGIDNIYENIKTNTLLNAQHYYGIELPYSCGICR